MFDFTLKHQHLKHNARVTEFITYHGTIKTPCFMPVGTRAGVNNMNTRELMATGSQIILGGNTFHMLHAPGLKLIEKSMGMHHFMGWHGPMLTDSGGFQVFSLAKNKNLANTNNLGTKFNFNQKIIEMSPTISMKAQKIIGADIIMAFDQCTPDQASFQEAQEIMERTHRWLLESIEFQQNNPNSAYNYPQALFGIIQGGSHQELRLKSAEFVINQPLQGIAIGGESIGFNMEKTIEILKQLAPVLPKNKLRYTMGVGMKPQDLIDVIKHGADIFDCVAPTRNARHGSLYCGEITDTDDWFTFRSEYLNQRISIKRAEFADDDRPIMATCDCFTCKNHSRSYLHHLFRRKDERLSALGSIHNISVMHAVCKKAREKISMSK